MEISNLIDDYAQWLKQEITYTNIGDFDEITTPFLDLNNDYIQMYTKLGDDDVYITDDGYTIQTLLSSGLNLSGKRKELLNTIAKQYGITVTKDCELTTHCTFKDFSLTKHLFVQCILKINDMSMIKQNTKVESIFLEDVTDFFNKKNIMASEQISIIGKTGFSHSYDFIFARSRNHPERLCNAINNPDKSHINNAIFSWLDTKEKRKPDSQLILIVNDLNKKISDNLQNATQSYDINMIRWTDRNSKVSLDLLAS
jgi:hypothetical protein